MRNKSDRTGAATPDLDAVHRATSGLEACGCHTAWLSAFTDLTDKDRPIHAQGAVDFTGLIARIVGENFDH